MRQEVIDKCDVSCIHEEKVHVVREKMLDEEIINSLAELFRTLGDPTRIKLLYALMQEELCVCDLAAVVGASESAVSHQLRSLRTQKLVKFRREGKVLYYCLVDHHIDRIMEQGLDDVNE